MGQNEAAEIGDFNREAMVCGRIVGNAEQRQRRRLAGVVAGLDRGELGRLVFQRVEPVLIAEEHLQRH